MGRLVSLHVCPCCGRLNAGDVCRTPLPAVGVVLAAPGYELWLTDGLDLVAWRRLVDGALALDRDDGQVTWVRQIATGLLPLAVEEPTDAMLAILDRVARLF